MPSKLLWQEELFKIILSEDAFTTSGRPIESMEWILSSRLPSTVARLAAVLGVMEKYLADAWVAVELTVNSALLPRVALPLFPSRELATDEFACGLRLPGVAQLWTSSALVSKRLKSESQPRGKRVFADVTKYPGVENEAKLACYLDDVDLSSSKIPSSVLASATFAMMGNREVTDSAFVRLALSMALTTHAALFLCYHGRIPELMGSSFSSKTEYLWAICHNDTRLGLGSQVCAIAVIAGLPELPTACCCCCHSLQKVTVTVDTAPAHASSDARDPRPASAGGFEEAQADSDMQGPAALGAQCGGSSSAVPVNMPMVSREHLGEHTPAASTEPVDSSSLLGPLAWTNPQLEVVLRTIIGANCFRTGWELRNLVS